MIKSKSGFTLVELIVVITILAILGTIAFISFKDFASNARDGVRTNDMKLLQRALGLYIIKMGKYPDPSNGVNITYSGSTIWTQGTFGDSTLLNVGHINKKPVDPLKSIEYSYSVTSDKLEYELAGIKETENIRSNVFLNKAYAGVDNVLVSTSGNYNGIATKVSTGGVDYILALPSIITSDTSNTDIVNITSNKKLVYNNYGSLPKNFSGSFNSNSIYNFGFIPNKLVVFSGSLSDLNDPVNQIYLLKNLQDSYNGSTLINDNDQLKKIVELPIDYINPSNGAKILACNIINFSVKHYVSCNNIDFLTFYIINVLNIDTSNLPGNTVTSVVQSSNGDLWFATDAGVGYFDGTNWVIYNTGNSGLVSDMVLAMAQSSDGDMWFGTNLGVSVFDGTNWVTYNQQNSGLIQNHILEIYTGNDGKMWIGTNAGVSSYDSGIWEDYTKQNVGITHNQVNAIFEDNLGNIWFGTKQGLDKYLNGVVTKYKTAQGLPANEVFYIMQDLNNNMRFGTHSGLSKYNRTTFSTINTTSTLGGLPSNFITYIHQNEINGDFWFGTNNGAAKFQELANSWTTYNSSNQLSGNIIKSINQNLNGDIIIMNDGGMNTITN